MGLDDTQEDVQDSADGFRLPLQVCVPKRFAVSVKLSSCMSVCSLEKNAAPAINVNTG
jgi:hypothetical protein